MPWPSRPLGDGQSIKQWSLAAQDPERVRYMPRDVNPLGPQLKRAIGKTIHVQFAGHARANQPYAGQRLYRECPGTSVLAGRWIPEQDLEFLD